MIQSGALQAVRGAVGKMINYDILIDLLCLNSRRRLIGSVDTNEANNPNEEVLESETSGAQLLPSIKYECILILHEYRSLRHGKLHISE